MSTQSASNTNRTKTPPANPTTTSGWNLQKAFRGLTFQMDGDDFLQAIPVVITDPSGSSNFGMANTLLAPLVDASTNGVNVLVVGAYGFVNNGSTWDRRRGGNIVMKSIQASASGSTAVWTPAAGKKFRLMGFEIFVGGDADLSVAGILGLTLQDSATTIWQAQNDISNAQISTGINYFNILVTLPANGYLSTAINQSLNMVLSSALNAGKVSVNAWGLEE